ncbi:MAG: phosphoesterase [Candidatus Hydrogenedentes bacterium]|nr:phosphoesterase [Candidatus Hydrogenedentota bacterium]
MKAILQPLIALTLAALVGICGFAQETRPATANDNRVLMAASAGPAEERTWIAGDSHIHSHWSAGYDRESDPPELIKGADANYSTPMNAEKAREFGLGWMVTTDHGGPNHSRFNMVHAYAELTESRTAVPEVLQFYGMELNMPAMDHHTLIIPNTEDEWKVLFNIESQFDRAEPWPPDPSRNTEAWGFRALTYMNTLRRLPLMFANHPSRSATGIGEYGLDEPHEFRNYNDLAPEIYRGMEGAPGHQAAGTGQRGAYRNAATLGGFDQMTAIVGGLWDSLLGEGRRFWIVASSDSHRHYKDPSKPGIDFWPGEYHKTYVYAYRSYDDILDGLRNGRIFAVSGDLITQLDLTAASGATEVQMGATLRVAPGSDVDVTIRFRDPETPNHNGDNPSVRRVDLIMGEIKGPVSDRDLDRNETTAVIARFTEADWTSNGDVHTITTSLPSLDRSVYLRVRGTSGDEAEPAMDPRGENVWLELWFYSNPIFVELR